MACLAPALAWRNAWRASLLVTGISPPCCAEQQLLVFGEELANNAVSHAVLVAANCACLVYQQRRAGKMWASITHVALCMPDWGIGGCLLIAPTCLALLLGVCLHTSFCGVPCTKCRPVQFFTCTLHVRHQGATNRLVWAIAFLSCLSLHGAAVTMQSACLDRCCA